MKIKLVQIQYSDKRQNENHTGHTFSSCLMITVLTSRHILLEMSLVPVRAANMTYARPLESLSSEGFFLSVILTVARGIRFMVIFKNRDTRNCSRAFDSVINIYCFLDCRCRDSNTLFS